MTSVSARNPKHRMASNRADPSCAVADGLLPAEWHARRGSLSLKRIVVSKPSPVAGEAVSAPRAKTTGRPA